MPPRMEPLGRPPVYCSLTCRRDNEYAVARSRCVEEQSVESERRAMEAAERAAAERRRNLRAGGVRRLEQLQSDAWDVGRCGWFEAGDDEVCQRRVTRAHLAWCRQHTDREEQLEEEALEAELAAFEAEEAQVRDEATTPTDRASTRVVM